MVLRGAALTLVLVLGCAAPVPDVPSCSQALGCRGCCDASGVCRVPSPQACGSGAQACVACGPDEACLGAGACVPVAGTVQVSWSLAGEPCTLSDPARVSWELPDRTIELGTVPCSAGGLVSDHVGLATGDLHVSVTSTSLGAVIGEGRVRAALGGGTNRIDVKVATTDALTANYELRLQLPAYRDAGPDDCAARGFDRIELSRNSAPIAAGTCGDFPLRLALPAGPGGFLARAFTDGGQTQAQAYAEASPATPVRLRVVTLPFDWRVGGLKFSWEFLAGPQPVGCAAAGVSQLEVYLGGPGAVSARVPCVDDAGVSGATFDFLSANVFFSAVASDGGAWWGFSGALPTMGVFPGPGEPPYLVQLRR